MLQPKLAYMLRLFCFTARGNRWKTAGMKDAKKLFFSCQIRSLTEENIQRSKQDTSLSTKPNKGLVLRSQRNREREEN